MRVSQGFVKGSLPAVAGGGMFIKWIGSNYWPDISVKIHRQALVRGCFEQESFIHLTTHFVFLLFSQFLLPARPAWRSSLWEQLRFWVSCSRCPHSNVADLSSVFWLKWDSAACKWCWIILEVLDVSSFLKLCPSLFLGAAQRGTHAWKLGGIQTMVTPASTALGGPSWHFFASWHRISGKIFTCR